MNFSNCGLIKCSSEMESEVVKPAAIHEQMNDGSAQAEVDAFSQQ